MARDDQAAGGGAALGPHRGGTSRALSRIVRVVPDVPSFSVDDGFAYSVPEDLELELGAVVRVPLGGRRVRGWVVDVRDGDTAKLKPVAGRSGDLPVFGKRFLQVMRWAAIRYVAPMAAVLGKATPPNVPRSRAARQWAGLPAPQQIDSAFSDALQAGRRPGTEVWHGSGGWAKSIAEVAGPVLSSDRSALVVAPTAAEASMMADQLAESFGDRVLLGHPDATAAQQTSAWVQSATRPGSIVVGTRVVAFWPVTELAAAFVVGEGRRGMKDKATPTTHAREVLVKRSQVERFGLVLAGLVPTAEALAVGAPRQVPQTGRSWGLIEVVDRRSEDRDGTLLGPTARGALRAAVQSAQRVLLFTHRRSTAQRCGKCKTLRACQTCGSGVFESAICVRCDTAHPACASCGFGRFEMLGSGVSRLAAEAARVVGRDHVGDLQSGRRVIVGTERDLPGLEVDLTIIVDADGPLLAPTYRAAEDGLRLLARAVRAAGTGRGRKALVQTSDPRQPAIEALRRGDAVGFVQADAAERAAAGFPPGGEVLVIEVDDPAEAAAEELVDAVADRAQVLGPADHRGRMRWLLQGSDLTSARVAVRSVVGRWRDGGARVRVDADPIDL